MNITFLTASNITDTNAGGLYPDLLKTFAENGHDVLVIRPSIHKCKTIDDNGVTIIESGSGELTKNNKLKKGLNLLKSSRAYKNAIKEHEVSTDVILLTTPPITLAPVVNFLKKRNKNAVAYLMLKDIFPQNAVDLNMMKKNGLVYKFFRNKEKKLYKSVDVIGCMSNANVSYLLEHNENLLNKKTVEVCPNSIIPKINDNLKENDKVYLKYDIPMDKTIFLYGGNFGKPQNIDFLIDAIKKCEIDNAHFLLVGNGTEFSKLKEVTDVNYIKRTTIIPSLSKKEYDELSKIADVGLVLLDNRFTIPNFPSRLLGYLDSDMPVFCSVDSVTDIGKIVEENGVGLSSRNGNIKEFTTGIEYFCEKEILKTYYGKPKKFLKDNYTSDITYKIIMNSAEEIRNV